MLYSRNLPISKESLKNCGKDVRSYKLHFIIYKKVLQCIIWRQRIDHSSQCILLNNRLL